MLTCATHEAAGEVVNHNNPRVSVSGYLVEERCNKSVDIQGHFERSFLVHCVTDATVRR